LLSMMIPIVIDSIVDGVVEVTYRYLKALLSLNVITLKIGQLI